VVVTNQDLGNENGGVPSPRPTVASARQMPHGAATADARSVGTARMLGKLAMQGMDKGEKLCQALKHVLYFIAWHFGYQRAAMVMLQESMMVSIPLDLPKT